MTAHLYVAYWDTLGFEHIEDLTDYDQKATWALLSGKPPPTKLPVSLMIMRAKANPQRFPEIWTFQSELDKETIRQYSNDSPQALADTIREHGTKVFVTKREKEVIV